MDANRPTVAGIPRSPLARDALAAVREMRGHALRGLSYEEVRAGWMGGGRRAARSARVFPGALGYNGRSPGFGPARSGDVRAEASTADGDWCQPFLDESAAQAAAEHRCQEELGGPGVFVHAQAYWNDVTCCYHAWCHRGGPSLVWSPEIYRRFTLDDFCADPDGGGGGGAAPTTGSTAECTLAEIIFAEPGSECYWEASGMIDFAGEGEEWDAENSSSPNRG